MDVTRIIAGTSGSPGSLAALRFADWLACAHNAELVPVLAWEPPGADGGASVHPADYLHREWQDIASQRMRDALLAVWGEQPVSSSIRPQIVQGPPGSVRVSVARRPGDLLVIGAGRRGLLRSVTGRRVTRYCAARAPCPVILVPPPALRRDAGLRRLTRQLAHRPLTAEQILGDSGQPAAA